MGLKIKRFFTTQGVSPFDQFQYERRDSVIRDPEGKVLYSISSVEVPVHWSTVALDILAQKYLRRKGVPRKILKSGCETSVKEVVHRMAYCWKEWGRRSKYFADEESADIFYDELVFMLLDQRAAPNSPQWFNSGLSEVYGIKGPSQGHYYVDESNGKLRRSRSAYERPQPHACFILSVRDDLVGEGGIMDLWVREARVFKYGSGTGTNFSSIRSSGEELSGGGKSSGLLSFLLIGDRAAGAIKSGGTTRRAAKMVCLDMDHPEIIEFIRWKAEEEEKVKVLVRGGYSGGFEGEAYLTVSGQNSNNSVRVPDSFFDALQRDEEWPLIRRIDGKEAKRVPASLLWSEVARSAWRCADPGVQFDTTINQWHTCPHDGRIRASNPCSEYMFLDDTACNLASLNLSRFYSVRSSFDLNAFEHACRLWTLVLEISVGMAQYPSELVARNSYRYRTLGLGFANLGGLLMRKGLPYDSEEARSLAASITSLMTAVAYRTSAEMAGVKGPFEAFAHNREAMVRVIRNHRSASLGEENYEGLSIKPFRFESGGAAQSILDKAGNVWDEVVQMGSRYGFRNAQVSALAPTGTIGLLMDCDTSGVEPDFSLIKYKKLSGGGYIRMVNGSVEEGLAALGYDDTTIRLCMEWLLGNPDLDKRNVLTDAFLEKARFSKQARKVLKEVLPEVNSLTECFLLLKSKGLLPEAFETIRIHPDSLQRMLGWSLSEWTDAESALFGHQTLDNCPYLKKEDLPVFDCAMPSSRKGSRFIPSEGHLKMMAVIQPFVSGSISKTINLPADTPVDEIKSIYFKAWQWGLKSVSIYRDGSKLAQPLSSSDETEEVIAQKGDVLDRQMRELMGDSPACTFCGHKTILSGSCYKCLNCGNSIECG